MLPDGNGHDEAFISASEGGYGHKTSSIGACVPVIAQIASKTMSQEPLFETSLQESILINERYCF
jgi:hypothetical protein